MARRLSYPQMDDLAEFVRSLYEASGFVSWAEFARHAGYPATNLSDVQLGKAGIDGANLLSLIQAAAARMEQSSADVALTVLRTPIEARLDRLERRQEELSNGMGEVLERQAAGGSWLQDLEDRVRAVESRLELAGTAQAQEGRPRGKGSRTSGTDKH